MQDEHDPERRRKLAAINTQAFRAYEMIADMMLFARPPRPVCREVDARQVVAGALESVAGAARAQDTAIAYSPPLAPLFIVADPTQISVAITALCNNALEALGRGGNLTVTLSAASETADYKDCAITSESVGGANSIGTPGQPCRGVVITVRDDGPGFDAQVRRHLFDPFYSGREAGRGLGFGLSKCWRIVTDHHGRIEVASAGAGRCIYATSSSGRAGRRVNPPKGPQK